MKLLYKFIKLSNFVIFICFVFITCNIQADTQIFNASKFSGIIGGNGEDFYDKDGNCLVKGGNPHQGFNHKRLEYNKHWMNSELWHILPDCFEKDSKPLRPCTLYDTIGFYDVPSDTYGPERVQVRIRSLQDHPNFNDYSYNELHQNDGWFYFRVKIDNRLRKTTRLYFELVLDNSISHNINYWKNPYYCWDWNIFRPLYRFKNNSNYSSWKRMPEGTVSSPNGSRCIFCLHIPRYLELGSEIEIAQGIPYSLEQSKLFKKQMLSEKNVDVVTIGHGGLAKPLEKDMQYKEDNEIYALEICRKDRNGKRNSPGPIIFVTAGIDFEPPVNYIAEGFTNEILSNPEYYLNRASFSIIPVANPDAHSWGTCHVAPYGNGEPPLRWCDTWHHNNSNPPEESQETRPEPEIEFLRNYAQKLHDSSLGNRVVLFLNLNGDLTPSPERWQNLKETHPPVYGFYNVKSQETRERIRKMVYSLRLQPECGPYVRSFNLWQGTHSIGDILLDPLKNYGFEAHVIVEYDLLTLFRNKNAPAPSTIKAPYPLSFGNYYVDGTVDSPDIYKKWGAELAKAAIKAFCDMAN